MNFYSRFFRIKVFTKKYSFYCFSKFQKCKIGTIDKRLKVFHKIVFIILVFFTFTLSTYFAGAFSQIDKVNSVLNKKDYFDGAIVYTDYSSPQNYLKVDLSKDYFIGYSLEINKLVVIPTGKINKIEKWNVKDRIHYLKYNAQSAKKDSVSSERAKMSKIINDYYDFRINLKRMNAKNFLKLLTEEYYGRSYNFVSPDIGVCVVMEQKIVTINHYIPHCGSAKAFE